MIELLPVILILVNNQDKTDQAFEISKKIVQSTIVLSLRRTPVGPVLCVCLREKCVL